MARRVIIVPEARIDPVAAAEWYEERELDSLIPPELFAEFDEMIELIREQPKAFPKYDGEVRRAILKQFPHGIYAGAALSAHLAP